MTHTTTFNLENYVIETDKTKNVFRSEIKKGPSGEGEHNEDSEDDEQPNDGYIEVNTHYSKSFKNRAEGHSELSKAYIDFDKDYCKRMTENPKMKGKLKRCPCGMGSHHEVPYGTMRYCGYFLQHPTIKGRR